MNQRISRRHRARLAVLFVCAWIATAPAGAGDEAAREAIRTHMEQLMFTGELTAGGEALAAVELLPAFYAAHGYAPVWTSTSKIDELIETIAAIDLHGLDSDDYFLDALRRLRGELAEKEDPERRADFDILLTESLARLAYHVRFGKVNPEQLDPNWNLSRSIEGRNPVDLLDEAIASRSMAKRFEKALPPQRMYNEFVAALATLRRIEQQGGWPELPDGPPLKPGMVDDRVTVLRERLQRTGDLAKGPTGDPRRFDETLEQAVARFQHRHALEADGVVGRRSLAALNVPVEDRIDQIRVNLERMRWVFRDLDDEFLITNIAGFEAYLIRNGEIVWRTRAQVGKPYRKTPVFKAELTWLQMNPTWTVPPTILAKDVLPAIKKDRAYLSKKNMVVLTREGKQVDPDSIDWASIGARGFPYAIRQQPGPNNVLGRIKFIFPNEHFVFLHDTPSRALFEREDRAFSSGCIRVEHPLALAEILLEDQGWDREKIDETLAAAQTKTVYLKEPLQVLLLYLTAVVERDGTIRFLRDVYDRDGRVLAGLDGEFTFSPPAGLPESLR